MQYIALNLTAEESAAHQLTAILPTRMFSNGSRPTMTGEGVLGATINDQSQWSWPKVFINEGVKKNCSC